MRIIVEKITRLIPYFTIRGIRHARNHKNYSKSFSSTVHSPKGKNMLLVLTNRKIFTFSS